MARPSDADVVKALRATVPQHDLADQCPCPACRAYELAHNTADALEAASAPDAFEAKVDQAAVALFHRDFPGAEWKSTGQLRAYQDRAVAALRAAGVEG